MRTLLAAAAAILAGGPAMAQRAAGPDANPGSLCAQAVAAAEREHGVPAGLLSAISRVESGRNDPLTGRAVAWPWTINAEGQGRFFATKAEAVAATAALLARGVRLVDVGCMQVNLHHHPQAFANLDAAFDPMTNARYAGLFLRRLQAARGDWPTAAAHYHSATPEFGDVYRAKVMATWLGGPVGGTPQTARLAQMARAGGTTMTIRFAGKPMTVRIAGGRVEAWAAAPPARGWSAPASGGNALTVGYFPPARPRQGGIVELAEALRQTPLAPPGRSTP